MIQKLPRPNIQTDQNHAFIGITDLLQHAFAFGIKVYPIFPHKYIVSHVSSSDQYKRSHYYLNQCIKDNEGEMKCMVLLV